MNEIVYAVVILFAVDCLGQKVYFYKCQGHKPCQDGLTVELNFTSQAKRKVYSYKVGKVSDKNSGQNFTLTDPIPLEISIYPDRLVYPLKLIKIVNNKPYEVFFHEDNMKNFSGCDNRVLSELCNQSRGFCCSCDRKNVNDPYHIRGGQDCSTNKSSAHCLKFDPMWYSVNEIEKPSLQYVVGISTKDPYTQQGSSVKIGSEQRQSHDNQLSATYTLINPVNYDTLKYQKNYLLIPQSVDNVSSQMMLIERSLAGKACDKMGVSSETFLKQPNKCFKPAQSCLDHQPMEFWLEDRGRLMQKKPRKYFLQDIINGDLKVIKSKNFKWSLIVPVTDLKIALLINISRGDLAVVPKQQEHLIREIVYMNDNKDEILYVMLYNSGYNRLAVFIQVEQCSVNVTGDLSRQWSLPPQTSDIAMLRFQTNITIGRFTCTMLVKAIGGVETLKIELQKHQKCVCYPLYTCSCEKSGYYRYIISGSQGLFHGPTDLKFFFSLLLTILVMIGMIKAVASLWSPIVVGQSGLCLFMKSRVLVAYNETDLTKYDVVYNERGVPVHPLTKQPVQILSTSELFFLNLCFGFYLFTIGVHWLIFKLSGLDVKYQQEREARSWHQKLLSTDMFEKSSEAVKRNLVDVPDKLLAYEQYKKQKKELSLKTIGIALSTEAFLKHQPIQKKSKKNKYTTIKGKSLNKKLPIQDLLKLDHVFFNYQRESEVLKNSGKCYSLCGILRRNGRRYRFELGPFNIQMNENKDGRTMKLNIPEQIVHPLLYSTDLNATAVHQFITTEPLFPCLNTYITYRSSDSL